MVRSLTIILSIIGATSIQAQIDDHLQERPTGPTIENAPYEGYGQEHRDKSSRRLARKTNRATGCHPAVRHGAGSLPRALRFRVDPLCLPPLLHRA
jgi:hypothetical protein